MLYYLIIIAGYCVLWVSSNQVKNDLLKGFAVKEIQNTTKELQKKATGTWEVDCVSQCSKDDLCTALVVYLPGQPCDLNLYGRVLLESNFTATTWIKSISSILIFALPIRNSGNSIIGKRFRYPSNN